MLSNRDFNEGPKSGAAKVYHKNLIKVLENLKESDYVIQTAQVKDLLIQANYCLLKLKKADAEFDLTMLENEYNYYREQFLRQTLGNNR